MRMILDTVVVAAMLLSSVPGLAEETLSPAQAEVVSVDTRSDLLSSFGEELTLPEDE